MIALALFFALDPSVSAVAQATPVTDGSVVAEEELAAAAVVSPPAVVTEAPAAKPVQAGALYLVTKVVDGDTITISMNGSPETLRLIGIDTPETVDPRSAVQCFGAEASSKTKELLTGKKVRIEKESSQGERDKYDRLLAYVYREDGLFINKYLVENGYAHEYTYNKPYQYREDFKTAENTAKAQGKGLWAPGACEQSLGTSSVGHVTQAPVAQSQPAPASVSHPAPQPPPQTPSPAPGSQPQPAPVPSSTPASNYSCSANTYNCTDFSTHAEAQAVFDMCGGTGHDIHKLDSNKDGEACESLP
jgi:endonuclease YncB( thermonuclease family)